MSDYMNEEAIKSISNKLARNMDLNDYEKSCVITALRKANDYKQLPYYEVIYHDEYDKQERRIMNPVDTWIEYKDGYRIVKDKFEITFNRIVRDGE